MNVHETSWPEKTVLITGASRGLGAALALEYARKGAHVVACARSQKSLISIDDAIVNATGKHATLVPLDFHNSDRIDQLGAQLFERFQRLDVLIGNAAILGELTPLTHMSPQLFQSIFHINVTANFRLIRALDPLLRNAPKAHAIFISDQPEFASEMHKSYWGPYLASKAALEILIKNYALENLSPALTIDIFTPKKMRTALRKQAFPGEADAMLAAPEEVAQSFLQKYHP